MTFGNVVKTVPQEKIDGLRAEALARLRAQRQRPAEDRLPRQVLQLHAGQKHALLVDSRRSRLYVFANDDGRPRLVADFYVTLGKNGIEKTREGDQKTPVGVYHVTANLPRQKLTDFYGAGAFPINYPNEWDKRQGRNGFGIWLHGMPSRRLQPRRRARATAASCSPTRTSRRSASFVQVGMTPVIIADEIEWIEAARARKPSARRSPLRSSAGAPTGRAATPSATCRTTPRASPPPAQNLAAWAGTSAR